MRKFSSLLLFIFLITGTRISWASTDTVNIRQMLGKKIESLRNEQTAKTNIQQINKGIPSNAFKPERNYLNAKAGSDDLFLKLFILTDASLVVTLFLLWRRRALHRKKALKNKLKKNIINLRNEKIKSRPDEKLQVVRKKLRALPAIENQDETQMKEEAKKYSISVGEVQLAAKIKSYIKEEN